MELRWTEPAVEDLRSICNFVGERDGPAAARRIALRIYEGLNSLAQFPRKGRPGRKPDTRELIFPGLPWLAIYRIRVRTSVTIDWQYREGARAKIRVLVKRILNRYGYPPDLQEEAVKLVLRQTELLCGDWV